MCHWVRPRKCMELLGVGMKKFSVMKDGRYVACPPHSSLPCS